jgi:hypothetical protein
VGGKSEADPRCPTEDPGPEQRPEGEEEVNESLAVEFLRQGDLVANARGRESPAIPDREAAADEPERDAHGANDRRDLDDVDEVGEEPVSVRKTKVLEEANKPGLATPVLWVRPPN